MASMRRDDLPKRSFCKVCQSGDTSGIIVPGNQIAYIKDIEIDTVNMSGNATTAGILIPAVTVQIYDKYTPTGGSAVVKLRKQVTVSTGTLTEIDKLEIPLFTRGDIRCNISGPVVSLGVVFE